MILFPAIDLYDGKAVRLLRGSYSDMTVYDSDPLNTAKKFEQCGATHIHIVDLEGARDGGTPNIATVRRIIGETSLICEIGGGIRDISTAERYIDAGASRVIFGTAAVMSPDLVPTAVERFGDAVAVGVDIRDDMVAIKGWTEKSALGYREFCGKMRDAGVGTLICTDITKDGAMAGTNRELYRELCESFDINIIASGGVSSLDDLAALSSIGLYGAIIGKAYYTGAVDLAAAVTMFERGEGQ